MTNILITVSDIAPTSLRICHDRNYFIKLMITHKLQFSMALMGYFSPRELKNYL